MGLGGGARGIVHDLPTFGKHLPRFLGQESNELFAVLADQVGTKEGTFAQKILVLADHVIQSQVHRCHGTVRILTDDDVSLSQL